MFVDALGNGLFAPFTLVYAHEATRLPLVVAGGTFALGAALATALQPVLGAIVDRYGALWVATAGNLLLFVGCLLMLNAEGVVGFGIGVFVYSLGGRAFWTAFTPLVTAIARPHELEQWFGRIRGIRYIGVGVGGALSAPILGSGDGRGLTLLLQLNAASFLLSAALLAVVQLTVLSVPRASRGPERVGYGTVLKDTVNDMFVVLNLLGNLVIITPMIALPVFVLYHLRAAPWIPGMLSALFTAVVAVASVVMSRVLSGRRRIRTLQYAGLLWISGFSFLIASATGTPLAVGTVVVAVVFLGLGEAVYVPTADALPAALAPPGRIGRYAAFHQMAWAVTDVVTPYLSALLLERSATLLWFVLAACSAVAFVTYRLMEGRISGRDGVLGEAANARLGKVQT